MARRNSAPDQPSEAASFLVKLHALCENGGRDLGWSTSCDSSFFITTDEQRALAALSPEFHFSSLSSFIRQLSYYNFKRTSDRRRSEQRHRSVHIVFNHESGFFRRGDDSQLHLIVRKTRPRKGNVSVRKSGPRKRTGSKEEDDPEWTPEGHNQPERLEWVSPAPAPGPRASDQSQYVAESIGFMGPKHSTWSTNPLLPPRSPWIDLSVPISFESGYQPQGSSYPLPASSQSLFAEAYSHGFPILASSATVCPPQYANPIPEMDYGTLLEMYGNHTSSALPQCPTDSWTAAAPSPVESSGSTSDDSLSTSRRSLSYSYTSSDPVLYSPPSLEGSPELFHPRPVPPPLPDFECFADQ